MQKAGVTKLAKHSTGETKKAPSSDDECIVDFNTIRNGNTTITNVRKNFILEMERPLLSDEKGFIDSKAMRKASIVNIRTNFTLEKEKTRLSLEFKARQIQLQASRKRFEEWKKSRVLKAEKRIPKRKNSLSKESQVTDLAEPAVLTEETENTYKELENCRYLRS